jgi:LmbE family N-acetylglucosaminyl deacetylase
LKKSVTVAIIVAHPDDETLWAGGTVLMHPTWEWFIIALCRADDPDRSPKFHRVLKVLHAKGGMGILDDGPEQDPLENNLLETTILQLLPDRHFDMVLTHDPAGEYTRHLRHEETSEAVIGLWNEGKISAAELRTFAYEDGGREYLPSPIPKADIFYELTKKIWQMKYQIITDIYGFDKNSFEALTTPRAEAFWQFKSPDLARQWLNKKGGNEK